MGLIGTYVFLKLGTTGSFSKECNNVEITELSLVAVRREHVLAETPGETPRVLHKLMRCFKPRNNSQASPSVTSFDENLEEHPFDVTSFEMINHFLNTLTKPVCLIAHNGMNLDFPRIKRHLEKLQVSFARDIVCADSYLGFSDILEARKSKLESQEVTVNDNSEDKVDLSSENTLQMQLVNETTPKQVRTCLKRPYADKLKRRLSWSQSREPPESYCLSHVYERVLDRPAVDAHIAENSCMFMLEIAVALGNEFASWVDNHHCYFADIPTLGLLVLTGALWGCTNPFIRQGTRGLRAVKADSWTGQAWAEVTFLLGNWRYVVPWLINQLGSLAYLVAVRRAPLSLAVPAANALAFAATAAVGAVAGLDEPLDAGSLLGICLIVAGTALCCWDQVDA